MIPGLGNAEFARLGGLHRNTYLDSPKLLDGTLRLKAAPRLRFAGQITGCEGYIESAAVGLMAGLFAASERRGEETRLPPVTTALGALLAHITGGHLADENGSARSYQPMNINFGLFPPPEELRKPTGGKLRGSQRAISRKQAITSRAKADLESWLGQTKADAA
jgi:methylenetetrahydrofolate--tRNA-(uracil-5-)-methyltransferase